MRSQFPIFQHADNKTIAYLDNAASAQKPEAVLKAMDEFYRSSYANVHRGVYKLAERANEAYERSRSAVAGFLNARESAEVVFAKGTTSALNALAFGLGQRLKPGDEVLLTELEHHANLIPWQESVKRYGFGLRFIPVTPDGRVDIAALPNVLSERTKVVSVTGMSNVTGDIPDLDSIISAAKQVGALTVIDAAQLVPHQRVDVQALGCDFLVFSGHKAFGPSGIGVLYGSREALERLPAFEYGGAMIREVTYQSATYAGIPELFEAGTPPIAETVGLAAALAYLQELGWDAIEAHERELTIYGLEALKAVPGLKLLGPASHERRGPVFAFTLPGVHPHDAGSVLDKYDVCVRVGHHCTMPLHRKFGLPATTRASLALYNTTEEIDRLVRGLHEANKLLG